MEPALWRLAISLRGTAVMARIGGPQPPRSGQAKGVPTPEILHCHRRGSGDEVGRRSRRERDPGDKLRSRRRFCACVQSQGFAALNAEVTRQAAIIGYIDDFKLLFIVSLLMVPLVLLMRRPQQ